MELQKKRVKSKLIFNLNYNVVISGKLLAAVYLALFYYVSFWIVMYMLRFILQDAMIFNSCILHSNFMFCCALFMQFPMLMMFAQTLQHDV